MSGYAGTGALLKLALRRDRVVIPLSVAGLVLFAGGSAKSTLDLYQGQDAVEAARALVASPAITGMYGPVANPDNPDSFAIFKTLLLGAVCVALLAIVLVRRHTRTEEEAGRTELVGAGAVGRRAPLTAAVIIAAATVLVSSVLASLSLIAAGLGASGSWAFGVAWAGAGLTFTGVTAVAAQLTTTTRGAGAWAFGALGVAYLLRAVGDTAGGAASWLTWVSPLGWAEKVEVFGADRLVVVVIPVIVTVLLVGLAFALQERRDFGAGLLPSRPGPATGGSRAALAVGARLAVAAHDPRRLGDRVCRRRHRPRRRRRQRLHHRRQRADAGPAAQARRERRLPDRHLPLHRAAVPRRRRRRIRHLRGPAAAQRGERPPHRAGPRHEHPALHRPRQPLRDRAPRQRAAHGGHGPGPRARHPRPVRRVRRGARPPAAQRARDHPPGVGMRRAGARDLRLGAEGGLRRVGPARGVRRRRRVRPAVQPAATGRRPVTVRPRGGAAGVGRGGHAPGRAVRRSPRASWSWRRRRSAGGTSGRSDASVPFGVPAKYRSEAENFVGIR